MLLLLLLSMAVATTVTTAANITGFTPGGLYIVHRNETPPYNVTIRQVGVNMSDPETIGTLSEWNIPLGPSVEWLEVLQFGAMDTKKHVLINQYIGVDFWYAANLESGEVKHIPKTQGIYHYKCLSVDTTNSTLLAIDAMFDDPGYVNYLNSFDMTTGHETHIMDVSPVAMLSGDGYAYDDGKRVLYTLTLDRDPSDSVSLYQNILNIINIEENTIKRKNISCQYKLKSIHYDPTDDNIYAFEYESGWMDLQSSNNQPQNQTVYIGKISMETWKFERLVSAVVPFYSNVYMTAYSPMRGYYVLAWPEPEYDPYISSMNGVLQIIDVRSSKVLYNDQVKRWTMRGRHGTQQNMQLIIDMYFSD